jgi:hypothetical protein
MVNAGLLELGDVIEFTSIHLLADNFGDLRFSYPGDKYIIINEPDFTKSYVLLSVIHVNSGQKYATGLHTPLNKNTVSIRILSR